MASTSTLIGASIGKEAPKKATCPKKLSHVLPSSSLPNSNYESDSSTASDDEDSESYNTEPGSSVSQIPVPESHSGKVKEPVRRSSRIRANSTQASSSSSATNTARLPSASPKPLTLPKKNLRRFLPSSFIASSSSLESDEDAEGDTDNEAGNSNTTNPSSSSPDLTVEAFPQNFVAPTHDVCCPGADTVLASVEAPGVLDREHAVLDAITYLEPAEYSPCSSHTTGDEYYYHFFRIEIFTHTSGPFTRSLDVFNVASRHPGHIADALRSDALSTAASTHEVFSADSKWTEVGLDSAIDDWTPASVFQKQKLNASSYLQLWATGWLADYDAQALRVFVDGQGVRLFVLLMEGETFEPEGPLAGEDENEADKEGLLEVETRGEGGGKRKRDESDDDEVREVGKGAWEWAIKKRAMRSGGGKS